MTPRRSNDVFLLEKPTLDYFHCDQKWRVSEFSWASSLFSPVLQTQAVKKVTEVLIRNDYPGCLLFLSGSYFKCICIDVHKIRTFKNIKKNLIHEQLKAATMAPAVTDFIAKSIPKICHGLSPQPRSSDTSPCSSPSPSPQVLPLARGSLSFTQGVAMACGFLASALKHWLLCPGGGEADVRLCGAKGRQTFN